MDLQHVTKIAEALCQRNGWGKPDYIDAGASAAVFRVAHNEHGTTALKVYDPSFFEGNNAVIEERRIELQASLVHLEHESLIRTISADRIPEDGTWFLLMEFCPWPSLQKALSGVPAEEVPNLTKKLVEVVIFLRDNGAVHRDIKPANIVVSPDFKRLKLLDLGVMRSIKMGEGNGTDVDEKKRFVATAQYSPPEYITRDEPEGVDGFAALNIYQVGAVLHDLIMKRQIFADEAESLNRYRLYSSIVKKDPWLGNPAIPFRLLSLCRSALLKNPRKRLEAVSLEDFLLEDDAPESIRKRLAPRRRSAGERVSLSTLPWIPKVAEWIASAAISEKDVLGGHTLEGSALNGQHVWVLRFDDLGLSLTFTLAQSDDPAGLDVSLKSHANASSITLLRIGESGTDIPEADVGLQFRDQILYALDTLPNSDDSVERR